ncbi:cytochrome c551 [Kurthia sibirica]|uniref:Cytochrome C n=1 Tax=Kurthia sibirica TaxID=202750 RepID=A0A2U3AJB9_9BACL|nr:cytochrome c [Kurthia sibirica]PWI24628.1 cytochrome C' [Kurthia sibirica]GEK33458.1 cytochrome c' [Kurthia sibirica]
MKKLLFALLIGSALTLGACGSNKDDASDGNKSVKVDGEKIAQQKCISCHGSDLSNGSAPDISKIGASKSAADIQKIIEDGQGAMPGGIVTGDEAKAVADWLATQK